MKLFRIRSSRLSALFRKRRYPDLALDGKETRCGNGSCQNTFSTRDGKSRPTWAHIYTTFRNATFYSCGHPTPDAMCGPCEAEAVLKISQKDWRCGKLGCKEGTLMIREDVVKGLLLLDEKSSSGLFDDFITFINTHLCECIVCGDSIAEENTPSPTRKCNHVRCVCNDCMQSMISAQVSGDDWKNIRCPELNCRRLLDYEDIEIFATQQTKDRYEELLAHSALEKMPDFLWCPLAGCTSGQFHADMDEDPKVQCIKCRGYSCFKCKGEWHGSQSCEEAANQNKETDRIKTLYSKRCPGRGCGQYIQKVRGCMEIDCGNINCRVIFCWECKIILDKSKGYEERSREGHLAGCKAKYVREKRRKESKLCKIAEKPADGNEKYRDGWDVDAGFVGTGQEY